MTRLAIICTSCLILSLMFAGQSRAQIDPETLLGAWLLDEGSGDTTADASGNGHDGTLVGSPDWVAGYFGNALEFNGSSTCVDCGNDPALNVEVFSVSFWCNIPNTQGWNHMISRGEHHGGGNPGAVNWGVMMWDGQETILYEAYNDTVKPSLSASTTIGEWHHVVATHDGATMQLYHDGELAGTNATTGIMLDENLPFIIGAQSRATGPSDYFDGSLDDVGYFNIILSPEDIDTLMNSGLAAITGGTVVAGSPQPTNGAILEDTWATLSWRPGEFATSHRVYFGESLEEVSQGLVDPVVTTEASLTVGKAEPYATGLTPGQTYYWRVDEVNDVHADSPWQGDVWSFRVRPLTAWDPAPADGALYVLPDQDLTWEPGLGVLFHTVYFGESFEEVDQAVFSNWMTLELIYDPGTLEVNKTYYWRIDEFTGLTTNRGDVWSFTTVPDVAVTDPDLLGWWTLDEGMGTTAVDWSGHGNHGRILGSAQWTHGVRDGALDLADGAHVSVAGAGISGAAPRTITGWARANRTNITAWTNVFGFTGPSTNGNHFDIEAVGDTTTTTLGYYGLHVYGWEQDIMPIDLEWHHLAATYDGTTASWYGDGELIGSEAVTINTPGAVHMGKRQDNGNLFPGVIDDVRVYGKVLTLGEIQAILRGNPLLAWDPTPAPEALVDIRDAISLSWRTGETAASHDVYLGTDRAAVADADNNAAEYQGNQAATSFSLAGLVELGNDYSWRIDEVEADGTVHAGRTWTFTVLPYLVVEDFESYDDDIDGGTAIFQTWIDGVDNGTGSYVGYDVANNGTFGETSIVHGGGQSMPIQYDNTVAPGISETDRTFVPAQDWTAVGVTTLVIHFRGQAGNTGQLYAKINGTKVPYSGDPADIAGTKWIAWEIDLASVGVNLASVSTLTIGIEGGDTGIVYVDDIWLTRL